MARRLFPKPIHVKEERNGPSSANQILTQLPGSKIIIISNSTRINWLNSTEQDFKYKPITKINIDQALHNNDLSGKA